MTSARVSTVLLVAATLICGSPLHADEQLRDRFIAASQQMGEHMLETINQCAPEIDTSGLDMEYPPRMVDAVDCVIEAHIDEFGRDETVALVEEAEAMAERSFDSLMEMAEIQTEYPRMSRSELLQMNQSCGTLEASQDLPMTKLMMENMSAMAPCFGDE